MSMNYKTALETLKGRNRRKLDNNTYLEKDGDLAVVVRLHQTNILRFNGQGCTVSSGGWQTNTMKDRLNEYLPAGFYISQENRIWYLCKHTDEHGQGGGKWLFHDGLMIGSRNGVLGAKPFVKGADKRMLRLKKMAGEYARAFIDKLFKGEIPKPGAGDCWHCHMVDVKTGKPVQEGSHVLTHIKDKYYVPSLLVNAVEQFPVSPFAKGVVGSIWRGEKVENFYEGIANRQLYNAVYRYVCRNIGLAG